MIKEQLKVLVEEAFARAASENRLGPLTNIDQPAVIERPRLPEHGDFACGLALKLAGKAKMAPIKIAEIASSELARGCQSVATAEVAAPGYINFRIQRELLQKVLTRVVQEGDRYGAATIGQGKRILIEYVSANPTGDLHIGHGRNAVFGSCLANLFKFAGYSVEEEFYINDAGEQIAQLGRCSWAIYKRLNGKAAEYPAEGYPEESIKHFVETVQSQHKDGLLGLSEEDGPVKLGNLTKLVILEAQKKLLSDLGIEFDHWFSETPLHNEGKVDNALRSLQDSSMVYESEGALWLKSKELGDERDRVLVKSGGNKTYLAADAAYHQDKFKRGYDLLINIWGADHHGQVPGLKAVVRALGENPDKLEVVLTQIVNLSRDGQIVRMSKRMGTVVLLEDLIEEVGRDAVRYYLAESSPQNPINFDLELAKKTGRENPAFYIQYAHARCCAILRRALEPSLNTETGNEDPPLISDSQWQAYLNDYKSDPGVFSYTFAEEEDIFSHQKALIMRLSVFQEEVEEATLTRQPGRIARYAYELANDLQKFYEVSRVITDEENTTRARLGLIYATKQVLANALSIIGVTALERM